MTQQNTPVNPSGQGEGQGRSQSKATTSDWAVSAGLLVLGLVPAAAGMLRVAELASDPVATPGNERFVTDPLPIAIHIFSVLIFSIVGAFQFSKRLRRGHRPWHRRAGKVLAPAGVIGAVTGLWLSVVPKLPDHDNNLLMASRVGFGLMMLVSLLAGARTVKQGRYAAHGAWMRRGYAIGLGAGTQAFTVGGWTLAQGAPTANTRAWLFFAGWAINLAVAEWHNSR